MPNELRQQLRFARLRSGARLAWATSGKGPALVRAAHWMTHVEHDLRSPIWRPWLERLGRELTLVRYDERGCGLSGPDPTPLGLDAALEELEVVIDALGPAPMALLGMSGAVAPAVAYAAPHPERITPMSSTWSGKPSSPGGTGLFSGASGSALLSGSGIFTSATSANSSLAFNGTISLVPEPAGWLLLPAGLGALLVHRRRHSVSGAGAGPAHPPAHETIRSS